jgi:acyl-coenzyme A synthetase/AMP-(fatty) acid ligase
MSFGSRIIFCQAGLRVSEDIIELSVHDIIDVCADKLSKPEIPKHVIFVAELPKTSNGKIMKPLKEMLTRDTSLLPWNSVR